MRISFKEIIVVLALLVTAGCMNNDHIRGVTSQTSDVASAVQSRAVERWNHLISGDFDKAYDFMSPGVRAIMPLDVYRSRVSGSSIRWKKATIGAVECEHELCNVVVQLEYVYMGSIRSAYGQETTTELREKWIYIDGEWWFVPGKV